MNDIERHLKETAHASVYLAADGSPSGTPRDDEPERNGLELGAMLEMGLESLLMHFRRKPDGKVLADERSKHDRSNGNHINEAD
jgi:hypothetical protein